MSTPYYCTLKKDSIINGQEIKAQSPLIIYLLETETPEKFTLLVQHRIARVGYVGIVPIGSLALKEIAPLIEWKGKK